MVRKEGLEPSRVTPLEPKSSASTSSATLAMHHAPWQSEPKSLRAGTATACGEYTRQWPSQGQSLGHSLFGTAYNGGKQTKENPSGEDGGPCRTRTYNQLIKSQLLYQIELTAQKRMWIEPKTISKSKSQIWGGRWDSNPRRPEPQSGALPSELRPPSNLSNRPGLARPAGLEPATLSLEG